MPLLLSRGLGLDALQPLAAGIEDEPAPQPRGGNGPPVINTYDPNVERWRDPVWEAMPDALKSRPDASLLLDKALHAIRGESGGDPSAVGDNGVAHGLFQSHYVGQDASPDQQIADAWRLVSSDLANGGTGFGDWGEGRTYNGGSFGAFGRTPYGGSSPMPPGFGGITWGQGGPTPPSAGPSLPPPMPDQSLFSSPNYGDIPYDAGAAALTQNTGDVPYAQGQPQPQGPLITQLGRQPGGFRGPNNPADLEPGPNADYGIFDYGAANQRIPVVSPALEAAQSVVRPVVSTAERMGASGLTGGPVADIASRLGGENLPILGPVLRARREALNAYGDFAGEQTANLIPTRAVDIGLTAAPLAGEASRGLRAGRGALERAALEGLGEELPRAPEAAATVEGRLAARGRVTPAGAGPSAFDEEPLAATESSQPLPGQPSLFDAPEHVQQPLDEGAQARKALLDAVAEEGRLRRQGIPQAEIRAGRAGQAAGVNRAVLDGLDAGLTPEEIRAAGQGGARTETGSLRQTTARIPYIPPERRVALLDEVNQQLASGKISEFEWLQAMYRSPTNPNEDGALYRVLEGKGLQPNQIALLNKIFGPDVTEAILPKGMTLEEALAADRGKTFVPPPDNPNAEQLQMGVQGAQSGALGPQAQAELGMPATPEGALPVGSMNTPEARTALLRARFGESNLRGPAGQAADEAMAGRGGKPPVVGGSQLGLGGEVPKPSEPAVSRVRREIVDAINAPIALVTYGHEPIFRQGVGFALSHPSVARDALAGMVAVARDPEQAQLINAQLNNLPYVRAALEKGWLTEADQKLPETVVTRVLNKIPGMRNSRESARIYLTILRKAGYESEAARLYAAGVTDEAEYKALWDTVSDVTGHGLRGKSMSVGGVNPVFSPQAVLGRFRGLLDPIAPELTNLKAGGSPLSGVGARNVAVKNLMAIGGMALSIEGLAKASGLDLKWDLLSTPLGKVSVGATTIDPTAGYGSIIRLGAKAMDALTSGDLSRVRDAASSFVNGQLGPVVGTALATITGQDWQGKDYNLIDRALRDPTKAGSLGRDLLTPIAAGSIIDAVKANGLLGALLASPSLGAMSVETNLLEDARNKAAQRLSGGQVQTYEEAQKQPLLKQKIDKDTSVIQAQGAPSQYQQASDQSHAPILADLAHQEDLFNRGMNTQKLRDAYHDATERNIQAAIDLESQFSDQFKNIPQSEQKKLLQQYYDLGKSPNAVIPAGQPGEGTLDFDKLASLRADFVAKLPAEQQQFINDSLQATELNKSPLKQAYDKYIAAKKAAGYFAIDKNDLDYSKKIQELDKAHPEIDAQAWRYGATNGKAGGALQTKAATDQALAMNVPNVPVHLGGLDRDLSTPEGRKFWADNGTKLANLVEGDKYIARDGDAEAQLQYRRGNVSSPRYADLPDNEKTKVMNAIRRFVLDQSPEMEALWAYAGGGGSSQDRVYSVSREAVPYLKALAEKYGNTPPKEGWKIVVKQ